MKTEEREGCLRILAALAKEAGGELLIPHRAMCEIPYGFKIATEKDPETNAILIRYMPPRINFYTRSQILGMAEAPDTTASPPTDH